jgi:two-component system, NtrC family, sensor kinase
VSFLPSIGIRGRLLLVLAASVLLSGLVLVPVLRDLLVPRMARDEGERLLATARVAAARAPAEADRWDDWARDVARSIPGAHAALIRGEPGRLQFAMACAAVGVSLENAVSAFLQGEELVQVPPPLPQGMAAPEEPPARVWQALVRLDGPVGQRGLLVVFQLPGSTGEPRPVWSLVMFYCALVAFLGLVGGMLAGHFLLVAPVTRAASMARRMAPVDPDGPEAEVRALPLQVEAIVREAREDRKRAERLQGELDRIRDDLKGAQGRLIRAEKLASVGQLAAGIAHEIGNPIGIALGMSEILRDGAEDETQTRQFAGEVHGAVLRVHGILKDLLDFARPSREEGAEADVRACIDATQKLVRPHKRFGGVVADVRCDPGPLLAEIRPSQLQQVLLNLFMNAADAMDGKGRLHVDARARGAWIEVAVRDEGPGIPEDVLPRIFDPFFSTKPPGEGTGLGLAICAQIVQVYGGEVAVDSPAGGGACFTVRLWRADAGGEADGA